LNRCIRYFIYLFIATILGLFVFIHNPWVENQLRIFLEKAALQEGVLLKIQKIQGRFPLKWRISNVHCEVEKTISLDIHQIDLSLSALPLLKKQINISSLKIDSAICQFNPKATPNFLKKKNQPLSLKTLKIQKLTLINTTTKQSGSYKIYGRYKTNKNGDQFSISAKIRSPSTTSLKISLKGEKKTGTIHSHLIFHSTSLTDIAPIDIFFSNPNNVDLQVSCKGSWDSWESLKSADFTNIFTKPITGTLLCRGTFPFLQKAQEKGSLTTNFSIDSQFITLSALRCATQTFYIKGDATFDLQFTPKNLSASFLIPRLSKIHPHTKGLVKGNAYYDAHSLRISTTSNHIKIKDGLFDNVSCTVNSTPWKGNCKLLAKSHLLNIEGETNFAINSKTDLQLTDLSIITNSRCAVAGHFSINNNSIYDGALTVQCEELNPFSVFSPWKIQGQLGGLISFKEKEIDYNVIVKNLQLDSLTSQKVSLQGVSSNVYKKIEGNCSINASQTTIGALFVESFHTTIEQKNSELIYSAQTNGMWKKPFSLSFIGKSSSDASSYNTTCNSLSGEILEKNVYLKQPFTFIYNKNSLELSDFNMKVENGEIAASARYQPTKSKLTIQAKEFPLDFLALFSSRFSLCGNSSIDIYLETDQNNLGGYCNFHLHQAQIFPFGNTTTPIQTKGSFQANFNQNVLQLHSNLVTTENQFLELNLTLPCTLGINPLKIALDHNKPIAGKCVMEGHVEQLLDFINLGSQRFGGFLSCNLLLSGSLQTPSLFGPISLQNGFYQNDSINIVIQEINCDAIAKKNYIRANKIIAKDEDKGIVSAEAVIQLKNDIPFFITGTIDEFKAVQFNWLTATCTGPFTIAGDLEEGFLQGDLNITTAQLRIPERLSKDIPELPITFINNPTIPNDPSKPFFKSYTLHYNISLHGEENITLTGKGLDVELAGDILLTGKNRAIAATGNLQTKKGKFSFSGKEFTIRQGELTFSHSQNFLNIIGVLELPTITATATFRGPLTHPTLTFESSPPLSTSDLLAFIIFDKEAAQLNPIQAIQLANIIITLAEGSEPGILEKIRQQFGIDRLLITTSNTTGELSVQIGKKLGKVVTIALDQSKSSSSVILEVELKEGFVFSVEIKESSPGKFSLKWSKQY
jgi:hypothetical protein